ncbi:hypothetical protein RchiOBHm_Chr7g0238861 [Rosa chinensis]|uniref:Uncharacterized protein n=1 Tax=Rosa chinensis TaxID=74649 RepID=A0A2P6PHJ6_ROSCH|nr:hypothetical protein RchiOBHm_Chr7g0238861 [Rosa chinensis]
MGGCSCWLVQADLGTRLGMVGFGLGSGPQPTWVAAGQPSWVIPLSSLFLLDQAWAGLLRSGPIKLSFPCFQ